MADLPEGEAAPAGGELPLSAAAGAAARDLGFYLHVPFCAVRCGYCDFTTYTNAELGGGASAAEYARTATREVALAARVLAAPDLVAAGMPARPVSTLFLGGGTPTLLPVDDLALMVAAVRDTFGLVAGAEVTSEANPDSVDARALAGLAAAGVTRVSFGMQSAVPHVLATLERTHDPARLPVVVAAARDAGLEVSVDLIYGTPGESHDDWRRSLDAAIALEPDHLSAYALVVEAGTRMGSQVRRGTLAPPDEDDQAAKDEAADAALGAAGLAWYEVSNWARVRPGDDPATGRLRHASRHNTSYWRGADWWGVGPGAHSHVGGVRWWNGKHPRAYAARLEEGRSPAVGREILDDDTRELERVMLGVRLAEGLAVAERSADTLRALAGEGLVDRALAERGRARLTLRGRLLADAVVRALTS